MPGSGSASRRPAGYSCRSLRSFPRHDSRASGMRRKLTARGQEYKVKQLASGFTLIELMIAVAIVGFLSMIALPAFQDYAVRSKMTEVILALSSCRAPISETYQAGVATLPGPNGWGCELGTTQGTRYVAALSTSADGMITA